MRRNKYIGKTSVFTGPSRDQWDRGTDKYLDETLIQHCPSHEHAVLSLYKCTNLPPHRLLLNPKEEREKNKREREGDSERKEGERSYKWSHHHYQLHSNINDVVPSTILCNLSSHQFLSAFFRVFIYGRRSCLPVGLRFSLHEDRP